MVLIMMKMKRTNDLDDDAFVGDTSEAAEPADDDCF